MTIEEAGRDPAALAGAIHAQLGPRAGRAEVHRIAFALDIVEIRSRALDTFEGALVTNPERTDGIILTNASSSYRRRRFIVAHELLHFLNDSHVQTADGFRCRLDDFRNPFESGHGTALTRHQWQEREANRFAIELLAPRRRVEGLISDEPDLSQMLAIADDLDLSEEPAARRYVELSPATVAVAFSKHGRLRYSARGGDFPDLSLRPGDRIAEMPSLDRGRTVSEKEEADPRDWLRGGASADLAVQWHVQHDGHAMALIVVSEIADGADEVEDAYDRITRFP